MSPPYAWVLLRCLQVTLPGVGELVRNRAGRIEFVFEQQLVEALELGLAPVSSSSTPAGSDSTPYRRKASKFLHM
jgi:hypothetical protein